jgi:hypothetical protein
MVGRGVGATDGPFVGAPDGLFVGAIVYAYTIGVGALVDIFTLSEILLVELGFGLVSTWVVGRTVGDCTGLGTNAGGDVGATVGTADGADVGSSVGPSQMPVFSMISLNVWLVPSFSISNASW